MQPHDKQCVHREFTKSSQILTEVGTSLRTASDCMSVDASQACAPATGRKAAKEEESGSSLSDLRLLLAAVQRAGRRCVQQVFVCSRGVLLSSFSPSGAAAATAAGSVFRGVWRPEARSRIGRAAAGRQLAQSIYFCIKFPVLLVGTYCGMLRFRFAINTVNATHTICLSSRHLELPRAVLWRMHCFFACHSARSIRTPIARPMMSRSSHVP